MRAQNRRRKVAGRRCDRGVGRIIMCALSAKVALAEVEMG